MNNEKVKEIKKALECCGDKITCKGCPEYNNEPVIDWFECKKNLLRKTITLINELESELEKEQINNLNCDTELEYKEKQIAELEKKNAKLNIELDKRDCIDYPCRLIEKEHLKQFAERLKEKCEYNRKQYCCSATVGVNDIDETLKECTGEKR
jgi:hypothetical protein